MRVEIWSDIACPWCYIGRRRFEKALDTFEHRDQVTVLWRSYQLDPNAPRDYAGNVNDLLTQRYGMSRAQAESTNARVTALAAAEGLEYHLEDAHPVNSLDAHRLLHLASQHNLQGEMKERLQRAYFTEGLVVSDPATLLRLATEVGLNPGETRAMLESSALSDEVGADVARGEEFGVEGVPFFIFAERYAISGAQPAEVFANALQRTWNDLQSEDQPAEA
jgi:predicted DsbA family dithiol-disulfide isomerase